jgi:N-methylhydantoinase A
MHQKIFEVCDPDSGVEFVTWRAKVSCRLKEGTSGGLAADSRLNGSPSTRSAYFADVGWSDVAVHRFESMQHGHAVSGPAIIESSFTTVVVEPETVAERTAAGGLRVTF